MGAAEALELAEDHVAVTLAGGTGLCESRTGGVEDRTVGTEALLAEREERVEVRECGHELREHGSEARRGEGDPHLDDAAEHGHEREEIERLDTAAGGGVEQVGVVETGEGERPGSRDDVGELAG